MADSIFLTVYIFFKHNIITILKQLMTRKSNNFSQLNLYEFKSDNTIFYLFVSFDDINTVKKTAYIFRSLFTIHTCMRIYVFIYHLQVQCILFVFTWWEGLREVYRTGTIIHEKKIRKKKFISVIICEHKTKLT